MNKLIFFSTTLFFATILGCGQLPKIGSRGADSDQQQVTGKLLPLVEEAQNSKNTTKCDRSLKAHEQEVARVLDDKSDELTKFARSIKSTDNMPKVRVGPTSIIETSGYTTPVAGWNVRVHSWDAIYAAYKKVKDAPISQDWLNLDSSARFILTDDAGRLVYKMNYYLTRTDFPILETASKKLASCLKDSDCSNVDFSDDETGLITNNPFYKGLFKKFQSSKTAGSRRELLSKISDQMAEDARIHAFHKNETAKMDNDGTLNVSLDAADFTGSEAQLEKIIDEIWTTGVAKLKIKWQSSASGVYRIILDDVIAGRSFVSYTSQKVHLFPGAVSRAVGHEIGHVLGLDDHYYTSWNDSTCAYVYETTQEDVMADHNGPVTDEEWQLLIKTYR